MKRPKQARDKVAEDRLRGLFDDLVHDAGDQGVIGFAKHIGLNLSAYDQGASWWPSFLAHYTTGRKVDEERVANDLASFPPVVKRVAEIRAEDPKTRRG
jgi:hypothetical protein